MQSPLVQQVLAGTNRQLQLMAARGLLPVPPEELIPLQVTLASGGDMEIADLATTALRSLDPRLAANFLTRDAAPEALTFFALEVNDPTVQEAVLRRRDVPRPLLVALAPSLEPDLQEVLLLRQDAIIDEPRILDALERNQQLSGYARRRIGEYRQHLVPATPVAAPVSSSTAIPEATDEEVQVAIASVRGAAAPAKPLDDDELADLNEAQVRLLPLPVRMKLSRKAKTRSLRAILIRDSNSLVATSCLENNHFSDPEIEGICHNRNIHEDVLLSILRNRQYMSKYAVVSAVARNPKVPINMAMKLVPRLSVRDLRDLRRDRNAPDPVRKLAARLYQAKMK